ncbi:PE domain-containing protein [Mycobacterium sp. EPa45]|uniref:PE domain-containing protein n=1 Tax=Mycobacterium sp. EPa45 TaxID=1545728 RepID=UPI0006423D8B|nr:PE domain-containing protein [Mycobacterium sp. EPa45]AKK29954.1 PE family protein [Mycobacterium sp. EPa45]
MVLNVNAATVSTSATTETSLSAEMGAATSAASEALMGVLPMGADLDSAQFAAALNAAGASYVTTATEHLANRGMFAGAQELAAATYTATDILNNTALAL